MLKCINACLNLTSGHVLVVISGIPRALSYARNKMVNSAAQVSLLVSVCHFFMARTHVV